MLTLLNVLGDDDLSIPPHTRQGTVRLYVGHQSIH